MDHDPPPWGGDPSIAWRILLTARLANAPSLDTLAARLGALHLAQGWPAPPPVRVGDRGALRHDLAEVRGTPLLVGLDGDHVVISAFHAYLDGLGLLEVLAALTAAPTSTSARGVAGRPAESGGALGRLLEVITAPPASVATSPVQATAGDAFAVAIVARPIRVAELVHAATTAIVAHNTDAGRRTRHLTVAIGAGKPAEPGDLLANRSELIRLRDLEGLALNEVRAGLSGTPLSAAGGTGGRGGRLATVALRALAPRLGSTVLVSHLGEVTTTGAHDLAFYPVTAGGTGLSLGGVASPRATTVTLRGRGECWSGVALERLLDRVVAALGAPTT